MMSQAIQLLKELQPISAGSEYLFPGIVSLEQPISGSTLNVMFARMGYPGLLTPHGIRATAMRRRRASTGAKHAKPVVEEFFA